MTETNNNRTSNQAPTIQDYASQVVRSARPRWERELLKSWLTTMVVPLERRKARAILRSRNQARLHLGCASNYLDGWTNIDLFRPGRRLDLRWDLRRGIPAPDDCAESILAEHLLEHIDLGGGIGLLKECYRVLRSGGVLRIGVPDLERYVRSYLCDDPLIDRVRPGRPTRGIAFCEPFFWHGHRSMYDFETLELLLREAGFLTVERSESGKGRILPSPDSPNREQETLYVEAVK